MDSRLAWVSGVSGEKGKDGSEKGRESKISSPLAPEEGLIFRLSPGRLTEVHALVSKMGEDILYAREIFPKRQFYFSSSQKVPFIMQRITYCLSVCY